VSDGRVTDLQGQRLSQLDSAAANQSLSRGVIISDEVAIDAAHAPRLASASYRDPSRSVIRLFPNEKTWVWYYDERDGLISLFSERTNAPQGLLGPAGMSEWPEKPAKRFEGHLVMNAESSKGGTLVLTSGIYKLNEFSAPRLLFTPPAGETIVGSAPGRLYGGAMPRPDATWSWFRVVTTNVKTYVLGNDGSTQIAAPHPRGDSASGVAAYRAPSAAGGPVTYLWYVRQRPNGETDNHVLEYRLGSSSPAAEYRFRAASYDGVRAGEAAPGSAETRVTIPFTAWLGFVPAFPLYYLAADLPPELHATAVRGAWIALAVLMFSVGLTALICQRLALDSGPARGWMALAFIAGPVAPVLMWMFLEWPARERCAECERPRVVNRERCPHCSAGWRS